LDPHYLNQNEHHNSASAHYKKNISFRKYFGARQLIFQLQADETKYQMDYRHSEIKIISFSDILSRDPKDIIFE
jgi:hypothetical protein